MQQEISQIQSLIIAFSTKYFGSIPPIEVQKEVAAICEKLEILKERNC